jgi:hypothetical protein
MSALRLCVIVLLGVVSAQASRAQSPAAPAKGAQAKPAPSSGADDTVLRAYATIDDPRKAELELALDLAQEAFKTSPTTQFEILAGGKATVLVLDDKSPSRARLQAATANPRLKVYVCSENTKQLRQALGADRVKLVSGVLEASCEQKVKQYLHGDWVRFDVSGAAD